MNGIPHHIRHTRFPAARRVMENAAADLSDAEVAEYLEAVFPDASALEIESFMRSLQRFGKSLAPVVKQAVPIIQRAAPGAIQGAVQGAMVAGPWGALAGAGLGAAGSLLAQPPASPQPAPAAAPAATPAAAPRPAAAPAPAMPAAPVAAPAVSAPAGAAAAGQLANVAVTQLLALLSRPETMQALMSLAMAGRGRRTVPVAGRRVPAAAFANALTEYASAATQCACGDPAAEHADWSDADDETDWFDPTVRAERLAELLIEAGQQQTLTHAMPIHARR